MGVAASGALGVYFVELGAQQYQLEFVLGPAVSVLVDRPDYKLGEPVNIKIVNSGTDLIGMAEDEPSLRIRALDGTLFFSRSFGASLESHEEMVFEWSQQKNDGSQVLEGRYVVEVLAYHGEGQKLTDKLTINILK